MLELNDPLWEQLRHVYGPAVDVPERIRRLSAADDDEFQSVLDSLLTDVYHQHDATSAGVAVVPHLAELAGTADPQRFSRIVEAMELLVAAIGCQAETAGALPPLLADDYLVVVHPLPGLLARYLTVAWDQTDPCLVAGLILMLKGRGAWVEELWQLSNRRWALPCPDCGAPIDMPRSR